MNFTAFRQPLSRCQLLTRMVSQVIEGMGFIYYANNWRIVLWHLFNFQPFSSLTHNDFLVKFHAWWKKLTKRKWLFCELNSTLLTWKVVVRKETLKRSWNFLLLKSIFFNFNKAKFFFNIFSVFPASNCGWGMSEEASLQVSIITEDIWRRSMSGS